MNTLNARIKRAQAHADTRINTAIAEGKLYAFVYWMEKAAELRRGIVSGYIGRN